MADNSSPEQIRYYPHSVTSASIVALFLTLILLSACGSRVPDIRPQSVDAVSLQSSEWYVFYSSEMSMHPSPAIDGAWYFDLPVPPGSVHYVQTPYHATTEHQVVSITFRVTSNNPAYNGQVDPNCSGPAAFRLFLERRGDDLTEANYRWWSNPIHYELGSQDNEVVTLTVPLNPDQWTNVLGQQDAQGFQEALSHLGWVGLTFGSSFFGHGVNILNGTARFTLVDYRIL